MGKQHPKIIVKFRGMAPQPARRSRLSALVGDVLESAAPVFPGDEEPELGSLFEVTLRPGTSISEVLKSLRVDEDVEYAHEPAARRPKRG